LTKFATRLGEHLLGEASGLLKQRPDFVLSILGHGQRVGVVRRCVLFAVPGFSSVNSSWTVYDGLPLCKEKIKEV